MLNLKFFLVFALLCIHLLPPDLVSSDISAQDIESCKAYYKTQQNLQETIYGKKYYDLMQQVKAIHKQSIENSIKLKTGLFKKYLEICIDLDVLADHKNNMSAYLRNDDEDFELSNIEHIINIIVSIVYKRDPIIKDFPHDKEHADSLYFKRVTGINTLKAILELNLDNTTAIILEQHFSNKPDIRYHNFNNWIDCANYTHADLVAKTLQDIYFENDKSIANFCIIPAILDFQYSSGSVYSKLHRALSELQNTITKLHDDNISVPAVINLSFSIFCKHDSLDIINLIKLLQKNDLLIVIAAGNLGTSLVEYKIDPNATKSNTVEICRMLNMYPGLKARTILVGAHDDYMDIASFSNLPGPFYNDFIYAPGVNIKLSEHTKLISGTSFAAPIVSGGLTLLKKYFPQFSMLQLKEIVLSNTRPFPTYIEKAHIDHNAGRGIFDLYGAFLKCYDLTSKKNQSKCTLQ